MRRIFTLILCRRYVKCQIPFLDFNSEYVVFTYVTEYRLIRKQAQRYFLKRCSNLHTVVTWTARSANLFTRTKLFDRNAQARRRRLVTLEIGGPAQYLAIF